MSTTALRLQVRNLLRRIDRSLDEVDADETITPELARDELTDLGELLRRATALLDQRAARGRPPDCPFAVGDRFWSEGLQSICRVLSVDSGRLEFVTEAERDSNLRTDAPLDLVRKHVAAGRWHKLPEDASEVPSADTR